MPISAGFTYHIALLQAKVDAWVQRDLLYLVAVVVERKNGSHICDQCVCHLAVARNNCMVKRAPAV